MKKLSFIFIASFCHFAMCSLLAQNQGGGQSDEIIIANNQILYNLTEVIDKNGDMTRGFLFGLKSDSLILIRNEEKYFYSLKDIINIEIEYNRKNYKGLLIGSFAGAYLGNILFFTADEQPTAYWDNQDAGAKAAVSLLFALVGGGIGYLIDLAVEEGEGSNSFDFNMNDDKWQTEFERLKNFLIGNEQENRIHINFSLSQVKTRYSEMENNATLNHYNYYNHVTSFNLLRKIQVTYSLLSFLDIGGSVCWFGEPSFYYYYPYSYTGELTGNGSQTYEGVGYYATAVYYPLKSFLPKTISWNIGTGIGIGNVNYLFEEMRTIGTYPNITEEQTSKKIDESVFSAMISSQIDIFLVNELSLGFIVDYIYVPGEMPAIPETDIGTKSLSNFSYGASLGFHF